MDEHRIVTIERLAFGGEGVGRADGKVVFVPLTAPGDQVRVRVTAHHTRYDRGVVEEVVDPSPHRATPRCSVFGRCGGCHWQHLDYPAQIQAKEEILKDTLVRVGRISEVKVLPMIPASEPWNYRNRIQLHVDERGAIGFFASGSHEVVPFDRCEIADERLSEWVRSARGNGMIPASRFEIAVDPEGRVSPVDGDGVFTQVHPAQAGLLREALLQSVFGRAERAFTQKWTVVDLYAGAGNFTLPLAERSGRVVAVDESQNALSQAERQALQRGIKNVEFLVGDVEWGLKKIYRRRLSVDTLVLDPPRSGAKDVIDLILLVAPRRIVYVSCDPATLARDLKMLLHRQYRLEEIQPIDMFPQTYHIESVARLTRV